jgi:hypothetical protein
MHCSDQFRAKLPPKLPLGAGNGENATTAPQALLITHVSVQSQFFDPPPGPSARCAIRWRESRVGVLPNLSALTRYVPT